MNRSSTLRTKITGTFALTGFILSLLVWVAVNWSADRQASVSAKQSAARSTSVIQRVLDEDAAHYQRNATFLASQPTVQNLLGADHSVPMYEDTIKESAQSILEQVGGDGLYFADFRGDFLGGYAREGISGDPRLVAPLIQKALKQGDGSELKKTAKKGPPSGLARESGALCYVTVIPVMKGEYAQGALIVYRKLDHNLAKRVSELAGADIAFTVGGRGVGLQL